MSRFEKQLKDTPDETVVGVGKSGKKKHSVGLKQEYMKSNPPQDTNNGGVVLFAYTSGA